jgi:hypothetical protein
MGIQLIPASVPIPNCLNTESDLLDAAARDKYESAKREAATAAPVEKAITATIL